MNHNTRSRPSRLRAWPALGRDRGRWPPTLVLAGRDQRDAAQDEGQSRKSLMPWRPKDKRACGSPFELQGWGGQVHRRAPLCHAAALDGYRVLAIDFDPQATLSHSMACRGCQRRAHRLGHHGTRLIRETDRMNRAVQGADDGAQRGAASPAASISDTGLGELRVTVFIKPTCWPTIDIVPFLRQCGLRRVRLGAVSPCESGLELLRGRLALARRAAGRCL